jgi:hypothetical protein
MEADITERVMERYVHKTQVYRLKDKESNRFLYPNLINDRFRVLGRHTLLDDNGMEETIVQIESLGGAYKGGYIFVEEKDIQKLKT